MQRLAQFDVAGGFSRCTGRRTAQVAFGALCALVMIAMRTGLDEHIPSASAFALVYPTILVATLYGRWLAGLTSSVLTFGWVLYVVLPEKNPLAFGSEDERVMLNVAAALIVLVLAESFRGAVKQAMHDRDREIERRSLLLRELEHRTRNNFALVLSLLELQSRKEPNARARRALEVAGARIHSFAGAYANLAASQGEGAIVAMHAYLHDVVRRFAESAFDSTVTVTTVIADCVLPREIAVALGLFTNEALTNCVKYAFPGGRQGEVAITFACDRRGWRIEVADNGIGDAGQTDAAPSGSLGTSLMRALAQQAHAHYEVDTSGVGRKVRLISR